MAIYDTAADIVNDAASACFGGTVTAPLSDPSLAFRQLSRLLTRCGRELLVAHQWQQFTKTYTFNTGAVPPTDGEFDLPSDFGYMINQTGWNPATGGLGMPLGGPLTEQIWAMMVASGLGATTIFASFKLTEGVLKFLTPVNADQDISFAYQSQGWVDEHAAGTTFLTKAVNDDDLILYDSELIATMLELRYKQAKGLDSASAADSFASKFSMYAGVNVPAPVLSAAYIPRFPCLNVYNVPQTGLGS